MFVIIVGCCVHVTHAEITHIEYTNLHLLHIKECINFAERYYSKLNTQVSLLNLKMYYKLT